MDAARRTWQTRKSGRQTESDLPVSQVYGSLIQPVTTGPQLEKGAEKREDGWTPEDVSAQNLGFDVRSTNPKEHKRYIEVKARAGVGPVSLTQNEWFKAQRFQDDYYLYVVLNAAAQPELYRIQNPASVLLPDEQMEVRYLIAVQDIRLKAIQET